MDFESGLRQHLLKNWDSIKDDVCPSPTKIQDDLLDSLVIEFQAAAPTPEINDSLAMIASFRKTPVTRSLLSSMAMEGKEKFLAWIQNPEVRKRFSAFQEKARTMSPGEIEHTFNDPYRTRVCEFNQTRLEKENSLPKSAEICLVHTTSAQDEKARGNEEYREKNFIKAQEHYQKGLDYVFGLCARNNDDQTLINTLIYSLLQNLSAVTFAQKNFPDSVRFCTQALDFLKSKNVEEGNGSESMATRKAKVLLRRAKNYLFLGDYQLSETDLHEIEAIGQSSPDSKKIYSQMKKRKQFLLSKEKKIYSSMFHSPDGISKDV